MIESQDPKGEAGKTKPQLHLIPPAANCEMAKALAFGAKKYGPRNWLFTRVQYNTYLSAIARHLDFIKDGESIDPESEAHHLGHIMANCAIVLDCLRHDTLDDNRHLPLPKSE